MVVLQFTLINAFSWAAFFVLGPFVAERSLGGPAAWGFILTAEAAGMLVGVSRALKAGGSQARIVARDQLHSPLLDERVPGELGDAFALMVRNLRGLTDRAKQIADGRMTQRLEGEGDLTNAFNLMIERHEVLSKEVVQTALHISSSAEEILSVLREQEFAASHQASSVEETQRTMETLLSSAKRIAESAQTVFKSAERTQANNRTVAERIGELKTHTERIGEILEGIKSIADRSDLLALNASLEGMRAGEAGKGFTLVAAEMRRLAENIKGSVADIKELLSDIRESALSSVMATEEGTNLSERTTESALKITLITQQQQSGTEQVTQSMDELSSLINQGVAGMRQVTTASGELVHMSEDLRVIVEQFRSVALQAGSAEYPSVRPIRKRVSDSASGELIRSETTATRRGSPAGLWCARWPRRRWPSPASATSTGVSVSWCPWRRRWTRVSSGQGARAHARAWPARRDVHGRCRRLVPARRHRADARGQPRDARPRRRRQRPWRQWRA